MAERADAILAGGCEMNNVVGTLVAVVITLLLIAVVVSEGEQLLGGSRVSTAIGDLQTLQLNIRELYARQGQFDGLSNAVLETTGGMPDGMVAGEVGDGNDANPWGGAVTVCQDTLFDDPTEFDISFDGVPNTACAQLAAYAADGLAGVVVNGKQLPVPADVAEAAAACSRQGEGARGGNAITWVFKP